ncbi:MAG: hypothetical protein KF883_12325 [Thermomicrobiales bacterium]|nr:hypothetical protein [Thermomicrobiales bacterium]
MIDFLAENPLFLLFLVIAIGYPFGRIDIGGVRFGVATTLFAGLAIGAIDERLRLPEIIFELGLVIFVYTIGLSSGREFLRSLRERGRTIVSWTIGAIFIAFGATFAIARWLELTAADAAGLFAGGTTNTPALAGVLDNIAERFSGPQERSILTEPVVAYSIAYPVAVAGSILAIILFRRLWRIDFAAEAALASDQGFAGVGAQLRSMTIEVTNNALGDASIDELVAQHQWDAIFGRLQRGSETTLVMGDTSLRPGDLVTVVGEEDRLQEVASLLGFERSGLSLELNRESLDYRRIFVSNPAVTGRRLKELDLPRNFGAVITRVRRGDVELLPNGNTILEPGDRVRVVTSRDNMGAITAYFGDSYRALSEIDILTFSLGIALGLGLGAIPIPLPGGVEFKLGIAGGPLVVALILGARDRTGPLTWSLPYSANLTLRQFGLTLFLAGIGTLAGYAFRDVIGSRHGLAMLAGAVALVATVTLIALWTARKLLRMPMGIAIGMLAGIQTQPAVLSFALEQSGDDLPTTGYAMIFPLAMIAKIIAAQILLAMLL